MNPTLYPQIESLRKTRLFMLNAINDLSVAQFNKIPQGYNNNIIWNVAHIIAAQEGACYLRAGQPTTISMEFFNLYKPGSKPETELNINEIEQIKALLFTSIDQLEIDLQRNIFEQYVPWKTRYGVEINNITAALNFLPFHEGMHTGYIAALKRLV